MNKLSEWKWPIIVVIGVIAFLTPIELDRARKNAKTTNSYQYPNGIVVDVTVTIDFKRTENRSWFYTGGDDLQNVKTAIGRWSKYLPDEKPAESTIAAERIEKNLEWLEEEFPVKVVVTGYVQSLAIESSDDGVDIGINSNGALTVEGFQVGPGAFE